VWSALYRPARPNAERAAILHIHGGGYRQFSHNGWSVYGYGLHLGLLHYLLERGYTILDFDYRGGAGYGRDYRTDIYRSMGQKDVDGALPFIDYLVRDQRVDRRRIGVYGVSYGGFFTLMALFRHPGVFAAGIANAAVTDWAHYSHEWTSRILGVPVRDSTAYRLSSPINHTAGLADPLLIIHGLVDDNVQFQDAARLIQKLIEERKRFEVMVYPTEPHTIQTEASRWDYVRRSVDFFDRNLLGKKR
jgi:dipeptidyl aminopeptidase/acylaminoacyl peptidase